MNTNTVLTKRLARARQERYNGTVCAFAKIERLTQAELQELDRRAKRLNVKADM